MKSFKRTLLLLAASAAVILPGAAQAHRQWMLPSTTTLSGDDGWVTVDAAVSNDLFYFDHNPMRVDTLKATAPDGSEAKIENSATGKFRSTFDVHLTQKGTYKIAAVMNGVMGSYTLNGEEKRLPRGTTAATLAAAIPAGATNVRTAESSSRNEIFLTLGEPTATVLKPTGVGLELVPITHPNDLVAGEAANFQFLLDGKPAAGLTVTAIPGGIRYRDTLGEITTKTDAQGKVAITWPTAGMYWLSVSNQPPREEGEGPMGGQPAAKPAAAATPPARPSGPPVRRASYVTTLEVLAP